VKILGFAMLMLLALDARATVEVYQLDPAQTHVAFDVKRFGIPWVRAWFAELSGDFVVDREGPGSRIDVVVRAASVRCWSSYWSAFLRSPSWLNTERFPEMVFRSTDVRFEDGARAVVQGKLSLHGATRPVEFRLSALDCDAVSGERKSCRFAGVAQVRRSDFGLPHGFWTGGDRVDISVSGVGLP
jgi:polyisoprenoid-binding protein YceI